MRGRRRGAHARRRSTRSRRRSAASRSIGDVVARFARTSGAGERSSAPIDLLVANAGISGPDEPLARSRRVVAHVRGERPRRLPLLPRRSRRGWSSAAAAASCNVASGAAYLPTGVGRRRPTASSKAAVHRFSRAARRAARAAERLRLLDLARASCKTAMTEGASPTTRRGRRRSCAPRLVRALAAGELDALAGRYLHAEHDPPESLRGRIDEIREDDLNAIRLRALVFASRSKIETRCASRSHRSTRSSATSTATAR